MVVGRCFAMRPRKIRERYLFCREEWPFQDERILINHHMFDQVSSRIHVCRWWCWGKNGEVFTVATAILLVSFLIFQLRLMGSCSAISWTCVRDMKDHEGLRMFGRTFWIWSIFASSLAWMKWLPIGSRQGSTTECGIWRPSWTINLHVCVCVCVQSQDGSDDSISISVWFFLSGVVHLHTGAVADMQTCRTWIESCVAYFPFTLEC